MKSIRLVRSNAITKEDIKSIEYSNNTIGELLDKIVSKDPRRESDCIRLKRLENGKVINRLPEFRSSFTINTGRRLDNLIKLCKNSENYSREIHLSLKVEGNESSTYNNIAKTFDSYMDSIAYINSVIHSKCITFENDFSLEIVVYLDNGYFYYANMSSKMTRQNRLTKLREVGLVSYLIFNDITSELKTDGVYAVKYGINQNIKDIVLIEGKELLSELFSDKSVTTLGLININNGCLTNIEFIDEKSLKQFSFYISRISSYLRDMAPDIPDIVPKIKIKDNYYSALSKSELRLLPNIKNVELVLNSPIRPFGGKCYDTKESITYALKLQEAYNIVSANRDKMTDISVYLSSRGTRQLLPNFNLSKINKNDIVIPCGPGSTRVAIFNKLELVYYNHKLYYDNIGDLINTLNFLCGCIYVYIIQKYD